MPFPSRLVHGFLKPRRALTLILCVGNLPACLGGAEGAQRPFALANGAAEVTLELFSEQADTPVVYPLDDVRGVVTNRVWGNFAVREALNRLVAGTGLEVMQDGKTGAFVIKRGRAAPRPPASRALEPKSADPPQKSMKSIRPLSVLAAWLAFALGTTPPSRAADAPGAIEGRIYNARSGEYLEGVRMTVEGTNLETFTDASGYYRLQPVAPGNRKVAAFFTGFETSTEKVTVASGSEAQRDFTFGGTVSSQGVVTLSKVVVGASREMEGAALAINEQRFAANIKNVVSTEEFGNVAEGNVAEFLRFLPGVTIDYTGGNARDISINGVPSANVPVTVDGFGLSAAANLGTGRAVQADMISINNLSRIEVIYSPTPESQGSALAGSVNMVPRSAFERAKPVLNYSVYLSMRDDARDFNKVPGPQPSPTRNVHPGFDFSYVAPINKRFGFTLSAGNSKVYSPQDEMENTWRGVGAVTNGTTFPHTTPDKPYLSTFFLSDAPKVTERRSIGATIDLKLTDHDRLTFGVQYSSFHAKFRLRTFTFNVGRVLPGDFSLTSTRGAAGAGSITYANVERIRFNRTFMPTFVWRHDGPVWKSDLGLGLSQQSDYNRDVDSGFFRNVNLTRTGLTIAFDDIFYLRPGRISVTDTAGGPVDPYAISTYSVASTSSPGNQTHDWQRTAYGSLRRSFYTTVPFTLKTGFDLRETEREFRGGNAQYTYLGPDGRPASGDEATAPFFDPVNSQRVMPLGFPVAETISNRKVYERFAANPNQFSINDNTIYRARATNSKVSRELISSLYLRGDVSLMERRLKLVGGLRGEQTNVEADGPLIDPTLNFRRDASGQIIRNANGAPSLILPLTDALGVSKLTLIERGAHTDKEYLRLFPSLNASYNLRDNLVARAAYYHSVGRPNFVQYSGGVTLPDTDSSPSSTNVITVNNAGIKAWSARTVNVRLEKYFEGVGQFSVGAFRREIENFFGNVMFAPTPEFLALYGLDAETYGRYLVSTQHNIPGAVRMEGYDFNYKQVLAFLPHWARGVQVFANGTWQRAIGDDDANFAGYIPKSGSWGISLTRPKYNFRVNWNYRGRQRRATFEGVGIEPGTFNWGSKRLYVDLLGEYTFWKRTAFFFNLRNVGATPDDFELHGPNTPEVAQFRTRVGYASLWTFGIKGTF
jgi:iron complex outermembrane recepter protein